MYPKFVQHVDTVFLFCRYTSYGNYANPESTSFNIGCLFVQCTIVLPMVQMVALRQCLYM
jgi:hypothetical protein